MNDLQERTHILRTDLSPMFQRLRLLFSERGVDPKTALLAQLFSDDNSLEYGIVVAPNGQVFEFDYDYLGRDIGAGDLVRWTDISAEWKSNAWHSEVRAALDQLTEVKGAKQKDDGSRAT
jgi:hypothetical protein